MYPVALRSDKYICACMHTHAHNIQAYPYTPRTQKCMRAQAHTHYLNQSGHVLLALGLK